MEKNIRLVVCVHDGMWTPQGTNIVRTGPRKGELFTIEIVKPNGFLILMEYVEPDPIDGGRRAFDPRAFIEITNSKEEIATVQVAGIQIPQLTEQ
jgi:hypothetical protein